MSPRAGASLIECLTAIVLLAIGLTGATATLLTSQRLERMALRHRTATRLAASAIEWFTSIPCPTRDSTWTRISHYGIHEQWAVAVGDSIASLEGMVTLDPRPEGVRIPIQVRRRCAP